MKTCTKCGNEKSLADFHVDKSKADGHRPNCKACHAKQQKQRYEENPEAFARAGSKYYQKNKQAMKAKHMEWSAKNPDKRRIHSASWRKKNGSSIAMHANKRRASRIQATPPWLSADDIEHIKDLHEAAREFRIYTGLSYEVDHIIPLRGKTVCGLHVPWNMQVIEAKANRVKKNKVIVPAEQSWQGVK